MVKNLFIAIGVIIIVVSAITLLSVNSNYRETIDRLNRDKAIRDSIYAYQDSLIDAYQVQIDKADMLQNQERELIRQLEDDKKRILTSVAPDYGDSLVGDSLQQRKISEYLSELSRLRRRVLRVVHSDTLQIR